VPAGGLAVDAHQHREETSTLLKGPALEPQKEQRSAIGLRARTDVRQMLCGSRPPVSSDPIRGLTSPCGARFRNAPEQG
jgi:hypothetical protein